MSNFLNEVMELAQKFGTSGHPDENGTKDGRYRKLYASMTIYPLMHLDGYRQTVNRFVQFRHDKNTMRNATVLDVGSHIGAIGFYAQQLGARKITFIESNKDRLKISKMLAAINCIDSFFRYKPSLKSSDAADHVICCSMDKYLNEKDRIDFVKLLFKKTLQTLVFESNCEDGGEYFFEYCKANKIHCLKIGDAIDKHPHFSDQQRVVYKAYL